MAVRGVNFHPNLVGYYSPFPSLHFLSLPFLPSAFSEIQLGVLGSAVNSERGLWQSLRYRCFFWYFRLRN